MSTGDLRTLHDAVVVGYRAGLDEIGAPIEPDRSTASISLQLTIRVARFLTRLHAIDDLPTVAEQVTSRPYDELLDAWRALAHHTATHADPMLAL